MCSGLSIPLQFEATHDLADMYSILILTRNEEVNLPHALASLKSCNDVVVFDSFSTDNTAGLAKEGGCRFYQHVFDGYARQRNAALALQFKHPWVLMLDADEQMTPELHEEICATLRDVGDDYALFRFRRKDMFGDRWIRRTSGYPTWFGRLIRVGRVEVRREINEEYHADGKVGLLKEHILHFPFRRGLEYWFERHNRYSSAEAASIAASTATSVPWRFALAKDPADRRIFKKAILYRLPFRPLAVFAYLYFFRMGFTDGLPGLRFATMRAIYEQMIALKVCELRGKPASAGSASSVINSAALDAAKPTTRSI